MVKHGRSSTSTKELKLFTNYNLAIFLITWDIIRYSNSRGFAYWERKWRQLYYRVLLGITDICPIELDLYFERFLNENRKKPT
jgi:DNA polymerase-3 subunit alpha/error-prone DNA polymerase